MTEVPVITIDWLTLFINGFAAVPRAVAGAEAVSPDRVALSQPDVAVSVSHSDKTDLANQLWSVFALPDRAGQAAALNALLHQSRLGPAIDSAGQLNWTAPPTDQAGLFAAACTACLTDTVRTLGWRRLGTCDGCDCADVYADQGARAPRRYCSVMCLNRAKVRAYRARRAH